MFRFLHSQQGMEAAKQRPLAVAIESKSIAVLPFENLSEEKANAYFADGMQDEILVNLARIADLKVISRTSVSARCRQAAIAITMHAPIATRVSGRKPVVSLVEWRRTIAICPIASPSNDRRPLPSSFKLYLPERSRVALILRLAQGVFPHSALTLRAGATSAAGSSALWPSGWLDFTPVTAAERRTKRAPPWRRVFWTAPAALPAMEPPTGARASWQRSLALII